MKFSQKQLVKIIKEEQETVKDARNARSRGRNGRKTG